MKVYQYTFQSADAFEADMTRLRDGLDAAGIAHEGGSVLFHVYAESWCYEEARVIRSITRAVFPDSLLVGTASFGNIRDGGFTRGDIVVTAMIAELASTRFEVVRCPLDPDSAEGALRDFVSYVEQRPWVKGVEAFIMADVKMVTRCCNVLAELPEGIEVFGGKSRFDHSPEAPKFVICNDGECVASTAAFVLYGGEELHVKTGLIRGWNPLGRAMQVTKAVDDILCELDGRPAYELYYKYLHINSDENFFFNTLEFPFLFFKDGSSVIRISHAALEDGSMVLGASIPENDYVRIAFGDTNEILHSVLGGGREFEPFRPDVVLIHSCACRRTFWGDEASNRETMPFQALAPTSGFYTAGEILRHDGKVTEHNSTMIVAALREGDASEKPPVTFGMDAADISSVDSTNRRLSSFVAAAIDELEEANRELVRLSITDGLTGLLNRREIERLIRAAIDGQVEPDDASAADSPGAQRGDVCLIMMDLDNFKGTNDEFGHHEGDLVLQGFAEQMRTCAAAYGDNVHIGRWGGEEFIALASGLKLEQAQQLAEDIRSAFAAQTFERSGSHSVSLGVTAATAQDDADTAISRADAALYEAKDQGKNRVVTL